MRKSKEVTDKGSRVKNVDFGVEGMSVEPKIGNFLIFEDKIFEVKNLKKNEGESVTIEYLEQGELQE